MNALALRYADALWDASKGLDASAVRRLVDGFIDIMSKRDHLPDAPAVIEAIEQRMRSEAGIVEVQLVTALPMDAAETKRVKSAVGKALGTEIVLETITDPSLIGGAVIRAGDMIIDSSVKHRLEILKARLAE